MAYHEREDQRYPGDHGAGCRAQDDLVRACGDPGRERRQEVLGLATEHAILGAIRQGLDLEQLTAATLMVKAPLIADISTSPEELIQMMLKNNCCSVVTIVNNGKYAGVVSRHMLMDIYTSPHYARFAQKDRKAPFVCL